MTLVENYRQAQKEQLARNDARRIRTKVHDARAEPARAARRWPFELLQNAHDAGPRDGREGVTVEFRITGPELEFSHDGAPFRMIDLAALLSGGSSKDFESEETTGRFGTGFLCTHALAERVAVSGVAVASEGVFWFSIDLDRSGDEAALLADMERSEAQLSEATSVVSIDDLPSARIRYATDAPDVVSLGLDAIRTSAPLLFATCPRLSTIRIEIDGACEEWRRTERTEPRSDLDGCEFSSTRVEATERGGSPVEWNAVAARAEKSRSSVITALRREGDAWIVDVPGSLPRLFRQFPIVGAENFQMGAVLEGPFDVDQERRSVRVQDDAGALVRDGLAALPNLVALAIGEQWRGAELLALVSEAPASVDEQARPIWNEAFSAAASKLASLAIVRTREGFVPAVKAEESGAFADFPAEAVSVSAETFRELADDSEELLPPASDVAFEWARISRAWRRLRVGVRHIELGDLAAAVRQNSKRVSDLALRTDRLEWLCRYLLYVATVSASTDEFHDKWVAGLIPDQLGGLHDARVLVTDGGISQRVKDVAVSLGVDLRPRLLHPTIQQKVIAGDPMTAGSPNWLSGAQMTEQVAIDELIAGIEKRLANDAPVDTNATKAVQPSVELLRHLWESCGAECAERARRVPLVVRDGTTRVWSPKRMMMLPIPAWPSSARPFSLAYPLNRVLDDIYAPEGSVDPLVEALVAWGVAHPGIVVRTERAELREAELRFIAAEGEEVEGCVLANASMSQIALLEPEIKNRCAGDGAAGRALLGLLICHVAQVDDSWRSPASLIAHRAKEAVALELHPSLWLIDIQSKQWVRVEGEQPVSCAATPELIAKMVDPTWLYQNDAGTDLLVRWFKLDRLDLRLLHASPDAATRDRLRDELARLVEVSGGDAAIVREVADAVSIRRERGRAVDRMRQLGFAVQAAVGRALERRRLKVELVDRGYDFRVSPNVEVSEGDADDVAASFHVGSYLVEVKATTSGEVRLTPLQASTATLDREKFVLCVVDLRDRLSEIDGIDWQNEDVSPHIRMCSGAAIPVGATFELIQDARSEDVAIRNDQALRYAVPVELWLTGVSLDEWTESITAD